MFLTFPRDRIYPYLLSERDNELGALSPRRCKILFYRKDGCHLCENMERDLHVFLSQDQNNLSVTIESRDIEDNSDWYEKFREYVPVLVVDDEEVCYYFLDQAELATALLKQAKKDG